MKKRSPLSLALALLAFALLAACVRLEVAVVDQKTALERQVLGTYEELNRDLLLVASVRGVDASGKPRPAPALSSSKERALRAVQSRLFNRDDIETLKRDGCAGENNEGFLTPFPCPRAQKEAAFVRTLIEEENRDRRTLMERAIETSENLTPADLPKVQKIFASLQREAAKPKERVQLEDGRWVTKE